MGLKPVDIINALGIVEIQAPACQLMGWVNARKIPMIKEGMGWAAATGYTAALMAAHGITGTLTLYPRYTATALAVTTHGGKTYTEENKEITGDWDQSMTDQEITDKFAAYSAPVLGRQQADDVCNQIMSLEQVADINQLLQPLASIQINYG